MKTTNSKPIAVITGDIHFTTSTIELATSVIKQMQIKALELNVPMILNGDTLDTKCIMRGEIVNRLIELLKDSKVQTYVNVGNHERINEKSVEHTLHFLKPYCCVVDSPLYLLDMDAYILPYQTKLDVLEYNLKYTMGNSKAIIHQGIMGADLGHYIKDSFSLPKEAFYDRRIIASHYHKRQSLGKNIDYIGNSYTLGFGEADHPEKGFQVLYSDGSLEFVPTNLRKHIILNLSTDDILQKRYNTKNIKLYDIVWIKITGYKSDLDKINKKQLGMEILGHTNFKLDLIPLDSKKLDIVVNKQSTDAELLDKLIDGIQENDSQKDILKKLWRIILE